MIDQDVNILLNSSLGAGEYFCWLGRNERDSPGGSVCGLFEGQLDCGSNERQDGPELHFIARYSWAETTLGSCHSEAVCAATKKAKLMEKKTSHQVSGSREIRNRQALFLFRNKGVAGWRWVVGDPSEFLNIASRFMVFAVHSNWLKSTFIFH